MTSPETLQQKTPLWRLFVAPMLFLSLAFHGIILLIPTEAASVQRARARAAQSREVVMTGEFGVINRDLGLVAAALERGWHQDIDQACFFKELDTIPDLVSGGLDALFFTRNYQYVISDELPLMFGTELVAHESGYCGALLYELQEESESILFASVVGIGEGQPPGSAVVIIWQSDPRN